MNISTWSWMRMRRLRWRNRGRGSWEVVDSGWFVLKLGFRSSLFICRNYGSCPPWRRSVEVSRGVVAPQGRRSQGGRTGTYRVPGLVANKVNYFGFTVFLLFFRALVSLQFRKLSNVLRKGSASDRDALLLRSPLLAPLLLWVTDCYNLTVTTAISKSYLVLKSTNKKNTILSQVVSTFGW